jgi:hypothetical protein
MHYFKSQSQDIHINAAASICIDYQPHYEQTPKLISTLSLVLCFYLAAPLFVLPFIKISLSAPLIYLLLFEIFKNFRGLQPRRVVLFSSLLGLMLIVWGFSLAYNQIFGDQALELSVGGVMLLRYSYWFIAGLMACRLFLTTDLPGKAAEAFGWGCIVMSSVILIEFIGFGGLLTSGWSALTRLSQNGYGWQFSAFFPFVLYLVMTTRGKNKKYAISGLLVVLLAIMINASRSSWGTGLLAIALFVILIAIIRPPGFRSGKSLALLGALVLLAAFAFLWLPDSIKEKAFSRKVTAEDLARDKSWQIRLLMVQKGQRLFAESPIFGAGPGQFRYSSVDLDLPDVLSYGSEAGFNEKSAHNSYIMLLAEGGLAFMVPYALLLFWLTTAGLRAAIGLGRYGELWGVPLYISLICFSIHFWSVAGITSTAPWFIYGFCAAMIMRYRNLCCYQAALKN